MRIRVWMGAVAVMLVTAAGAKAQYTFSCPAADHLSVTVTKTAGTSQNQTVADEKVGNAGSHKPAENRKFSPLTIWTSLASKATFDKLAASHRDLPQCTLVASQESIVYSDVSIASVTEVAQQGKAMERQLKVVVNYKSLAWNAGAQNTQNKQGQQSKQKMH